MATEYSELIATLEAHHELNREEFSAIHTKLSAMDDKFSVMDDKFSVMDGKFSALDGKVSILGGSVSVLSGTVSDLAGTVSILGSTVAALDRKVSELYDYSVGTRTALNELSVQTAERFNTVYERFNTVDDRGDRMEAAHNDLKQEMRAGFRSMEEKFAELTDIVIGLRDAS